MKRPKDVPGIEVGATVRILTKSAQILSARPMKTPTGTVGSVRDVVGENLCVVTVQNADRSVAYHGDAPRPGDRVVLDFTMSAVLHNLGQQSGEFALEGDVGVTWDDILGQEEAKRLLLEAIEEPVLHEATYARFGKRRTKGVLLWGPAGNGKTMFGKAAAGALANLYGAKGRAGAFLYVKGPELLNKYVGASEGNVRSLFESAREYQRKHGHPSVLFIDEAEAVLSKRGTFRGEGADTQRTIVPMFLAEMDGLEDSGAFILLATNRPQDLDPAVVRDGRIDRKVHVKRPGAREAELILGHYLRGKPIDGKLAPMVKAAIADLYAESRVLYMIRSKDGKEDRRFTFAHLVSGAMVAGIAEKATQLAIRREIATKKSASMTTADLSEAIASVFAENRSLDHNEALAEVVEPIRDNVRAIERVTVEGVKG